MVDAGAAAGGQPNVTRAAPRSVSCGRHVSADVRVPRPFRPAGASAMRTPYRRATTSDLDRLLELQRGFYVEQGYPYDAAAMRHVWPRLLTDPWLGQAWLAEEDRQAVAYVVATLGYSLEHLGRDAFVDELYVAPSHRGRGLGRAALAQVECW